MATQMVKFSVTYFIVIITLTAFAVFISEKVVVEGNKQPFNARQSKDLRRLAHADFELLTKLKGWSGAWEAHGQTKTASQTLFTTTVQAYLENFSSNYTVSSNDRTRTDHVEEILRNPLATFRVIHRLCNFLHSLQSLPDLDEIIAEVPFLTTLMDEFGKDRFPLLRDALADATDAILQIQFMYNLKASDLSQGIVFGIASTTKLKANHCHYIGLVAKLWKRYTLAVEWLVEAKRLAKIAGTAVEDIPTINADLVEIIKQHDEFMWRLKFKDPYFFMKPLKSLKSVDQEMIPTVREIQQSKFAGQGRNCSFWNMNVWSLCLGQDLKRPEASSHLFCWQEFKVNPAFTIGPLRMEFLSRNPDAVQVHSAFSNPELAELSAASVPPGVVSTRTEHLIGQKLEAITGLQTTRPSAANPIELIHHLPGGNVETHVDFLGDSDGKEDQISTAMIYLNDVAKGGYTVFPTSFATTIPSKGSAVVWFNTFSDGTQDYSTAHEECPVIWGEKLVAYKRMQFYDQFKVRKCSLRPKERFRVLVNGEALPVPRGFAHKTIKQEEFDKPEPLSIDEEAAAYNKDYYEEDPRIMKYAQSPRDNLEALLQLDLEIYQNIKRLLPPRIAQVGSDQARSLILSYLEDLNQNAYSAILLNTSTNVAEAVGKLSRNPLAVYRAFRRFENYIKKLLRLPDKDLADLQEVRDFIGKVYNENDGPLKQDLEDIMAGILNMQYFYDLKSQDIGRGIVAGIDTGITLSAEQCIELGSHAIFNHYYYQSIDWMETAVAKVASENDTTVSLTMAEVQLETAKEVHDRFLVKFPENEPSFYTEPVSGLSDFTQLKKRKEILYNANKGRTEHQFSELNLFGLCQGKRHQTIQEQSKLFCWYEHQIHPHFRVGPLKVELLSMHPKPEVVLYHDVSSPQVLAFLRNDTGISYSSCGSNPNACLYVSSMVYKNESEHVRKLAGRILGLNTARRGLSMHVHMPGGHHGLHADAYGQEDGHGEENEAKGMTTLLFYGTEPEKGGMTAFAQAGIQVPVKAGSAVMWFNTLSSGAFDAMSYHAGCPVIFGHKRVASVLTSYVGQSHLKCSTDPMRQLEVLVNGKSKYGYR